MVPTLRSQLVPVIVAIATIPLVIFGLIAGLWSARELERQSLVLQTEVAKRIERDVAGFLSTRIDELRVLEQTNTLLGRNAAAVTSTFGRLLAHDKAFQAVSIVGADGELRAFTSRARISPQDPDRWKKARFNEAEFWKHQSHFVGPVRFDRDLREPLLDIAVPILERRTGAVDSVLLATVRFKPIWNLLADLSLPAQTEAFVVDTAGIVVAHRSPALVLSEKVMALPDRPGRSSILNGEDGLVAWQPLSIVSGTSHVVVTRSLAAALERANTAGMISVLLSVGLLMASGVIGLWQTRKIVAPVEALAISARRISKGDLASPVEAHGPREISALGQTLEEMRQRLGQTISQLERSEYAERQRALVTLESIGDAVITTDRQGLIAYLNPVAEEVTGWTQQEAQGQSLPDVFQVLDGSSREPVPNPVERCLASNDVIELASNTVLVRKNGEERLIRDSAAPIRERDGQVVGVVLVFRDVTEREALQIALRQSQKMEALGQLTGGIAHDFNNLLQVIQGNAELLAEERGCDPELALPILKATARGSELTSRLLSFSRRQMLVPRTIVLRDLLGDLIPMLDRTLGETIQVSVEIGPDIWPVLVDPGQFESALLNLLLNARDAMKSGGRITIAARNASATELGKQDQKSLDERDYVALSVTDTGSGMSAATLEKAIDPFFTTKGVGEGSGLGLSMVYGFVMQSEGRFKIQSEPGEGTTAIMYLPRSEAPEAAKTDVPTEAPTATGDKKILIIEDDPDVCALASRSVTGLGYRALTAPDVAAARSLVRQDGGIDLVLTDVVLPGGASGIDFARELSETYPGLPVVFMSGYPRDELDLGQIDGAKTVLLAKPFKRSDLAVVLRSMLETDHRP